MFGNVRHHTAVGESGMARKFKGQLTVSGEWARHLRPLLRRAFWKGERQAGKRLVRTEPRSAEGQTEPSRDDR